MLTSALRLYFENPVGRVLEHPNGYPVVQYKPGPRQLSHLQSFLTHTGQLLRLRGWNKLLGDQRQMAPFTDEERSWIVDYWLSNTNQSTEIYGAVIVPNDVFARLSVNNVMLEAKTAALTYRLFDDEAQAVAWLHQLP